MMLDSVVQLTDQGRVRLSRDDGARAAVRPWAGGKARSSSAAATAGVLREALKHPALEQVTLCEIDRGVIDLCREHFPAISAGAYDDPRTRIVIADGTKFVAETDERFDVIMVDSTDPIGPGAVLFTQGVLRRLPRAPQADGGVARHPERASVPAGAASSSRASASSARCSRTPLPISPPRPAISAARCPMAGPPTTPISGTSPQEDRAAL